MPPANPAAGKVVIQEASPILISAKAPLLAAARKVADWWMSPEGSAAFAKMVMFLMGLGTIPWIITAMIFTSVPTILLFVFLRRFLIQGMVLSVSA